MKTLTLLVALLVGFWTSATAQNRIQPVVSNVRVETDAQRVKVMYSVVGITERDSVFLRVESRSRGALNPKTITGDIGKAVQPGPNKTIYWNYALDGERLDEIRVTVNVQQAAESSKPIADKGPQEPSGKTKIAPGGPQYALLSALAPGVGNILVQPNRKIGLRPLITVSYVGLLAYGLAQKSQSRKQYDLYEAQLNEQDAQPYYDAANRYHQRYFLATRAAAVVWLSDVTYTLLKGLRNQKQARANGGLSLQYSGTTPTLAFRRSF